MGNSRVAAPDGPGERRIVVPAAGGMEMAKRSDEARPRAPQAAGTGPTLATGALVLGIAGLGAGAVATGVGGLIAKAVVAVVRSVFSAVGGFLAR
jgi:hypothetical protein